MDSEFIDPCRDWSEFHHCKPHTKQYNIAVDKRNVSSSTTTVQIIPKTNIMKYDECIDPCRDWKKFHCV